MKAARNPMTPKARESLSTLPAHLHALGEWILTDPRMRSSTACADMIDVARDNWEGPTALLSTWPAQYLALTLHCKYVEVAAACALAAQRVGTGYLIPPQDAPDSPLLRELVEAGYLEERNGYWMCEEVFESFDRENKMLAAISRLSPDEQMRLVEYVFGEE